MDHITLNNSTIHFIKDHFNPLNEYLREHNVSLIFILVDDMTLENCYPYFVPFLDTDARIEIIEIDHGEEYKNIETCVGIWQAMVELGGDRKSLMINLGGGVITDIGGFIASTFKRGIPFIHVPTSLLGMVDAAIGGKNGVDLGHLKNQIGVINSPEMTIVNPNFLNTLDQRQLINGSIEMFKHGLIADRVYWENMLSSQSFNDETFHSLIYQSMVIKSDIVAGDPFEKGARKSLNYGHTIGHAIESYCLENDDMPDLLHGEAIAAGLLLESFISVHLSGLPEEQFEQIESWYGSLNLEFNFIEDDLSGIIAYMAHDKKNEDGQIKFVLLTEIGNYKVNQEVPSELIYNAFKLLN